jgi:hypothetical protein
VQAVKEQFPDESYDLTQLVIMFSVDDDPTISIEFEKDQCGWICSLQGSDKVHVRFHACNGLELDLIQNVPRDSIIATKVDNRVHDSIA